MSKIVKFERKPITKIRKVDIASKLLLKTAYEKSPEAMLAYMSGLESALGIETNIGFKEFMIRYYRIPKEYHEVVLKKASHLLGEDSR